MTDAFAPAIPQRFQPPDADLDYPLDWTAFLALGSPTDTIATSTWTVPAGLVGHSDSHQSHSTVIWLKGGTMGVNYPVVNHIVTAEGREQDQTIMLFIEQF